MDCPYSQIMNSQDDFTSLRYELQEVEFRIRRDFQERHLAWLELARKALLLIARMIVEASHSREHRDRPSVPGSEVLPVPDLHPRGIDIQEYHANTPEKFELLEGYLFDTAEHLESRRRLLALLLVNVGLLEAVRLVPKDLWLDAIDHVYGSDASPAESIGS
ncbi:MAG: hypothetical protein WD773_05080 [Gemmatimonadales bacterium]